MSADFAGRLTHMRKFDERASECKFLLGGIGTGNISVGARGQLTDYELFNRPGKGTKFPYSFFAIHFEAGGHAVNRVLEAPVQPPYALSHGFDSWDMAGLPRMKHSVMSAEYPLCRVDLTDENAPFSVSLDAYTPFVPLDVDASSLPGAILRYRVRNLTDESAFCAVAGSLANMAGFVGLGDFNNPKFAGEAKNTAVREEGLSGLLMESTDFPADHPMRASFSLTTTCKDFTLKPVWYEGSWFDGIQDFWDDFSTDGKLREQNVYGGEGNKLMHNSFQRVGSLVPYAVIPPRGEYEFEFLITWHVPNRVLGWGQDTPSQCCGNGCDCAPKITRNYYALKFENAFSVAREMVKDMAALEERTLAFHKALFESTLPAEVLDAVSANITVLRSTTCFRVEDGTFFGWEGCFDRAGCCDGTCTHVWNYAQTLAFLFPTLEQTMRRNEFAIETEPDGKQNFRARKALKDKPWEMHPAADGQNGSIVRLYREWKLSGASSLIDDLGEAALRALDFSARCWDADGDGVLDSQQHNTYDIEFYGPNSLTNSMYFCALKAGAEMAEYLHQPERAADYRARFEAGSARMDAMLWGGEYYIQKLDDVDHYKYQYGDGCLSDQIIGQFMAHVSGLGYVLPEEHVKATAYSIYKYNLLNDFSEHFNVQRTYALNGERGLLLCSWPRGGRPRFPFVYCDEVWTGIEYQVAATLMYEGMVEEGLDIVRAVRERHDGIRRNPFNEVECGHHYARSMASWALLTALSGFQCDLTKDEVSFEPKVNQDDFQCFFSTGKQWGVYRQKKLPGGELSRETQVLYQAP